MACEDLGRLMFGSSDLGSEAFRTERPQIGNDLGVVEGDFGIEGSSGQRMTLGKLSVTGASV